ncbi:MAG: acyl-CoA dehydrogenase family protein [bacterium]
MKYYDKLGLDFLATLRYNLQGDNTMRRNHLQRFFSSYGINHFTLDKPFQLALEYAGLESSYFNQLTELGEFVSTDLLEISDHIDRISKPHFQMWDIDGSRMDWVQLNPAHKNLLEKLLDFGIVHAVYSEGAPWQFHYAQGYLVADPGLYCTLTVTNQTAYALFKYGSPEIKQRFLAHYLDADSSKAWYGATFYTETHGGSDLGANRATAKRDGGRWQLTSQDKYFASNAGIADGALVTARPEGRPAGAKGIALFFVPAYKEDGSPNYFIRRLKDKLGTRAVPTGEVELASSEAYLIGTVEHGIYHALEVLTLARLANSIAAVGIARKSYLEALYYCQKRQAFGKKLIEHPLVQKDLLEMEVELEANLLLALKAIQKFNVHWNETPPYSSDYHYARLLAHLAKNMTAEMSAWVTRQAMELHGGLGFLDEFPVARWHREALITSIWEGTSNIQALDMLEVMAKKGAHKQLFSEIEKILATVEDEFLTKAVKERLNLITQELEDLVTLNTNESQYYAKDLLISLGELASAAFLLDAGESIAETNGDQRFRKVAEIYIRRHLIREKLPLNLLQNSDLIIYLDK